MGVLSSWPSTASRSSCSACSRFNSSRKRVTSRLDCSRARWVNLAKAPPDSSSSRAPTSHSSPARTGIRCTCNDRELPSELPRPQRTPGPFRHGRPSPESFRRSTIDSPISESGEAQPSRAAIRSEAHQIRPSRQRARPSSTTSAIDAIFSPGTAFILACSSQLPSALIAFSTAASRRGIFPVRARSGSGLLTLSIALLKRGL